MRQRIFSPRYPRLTCKEGGEEGNENEVGATTGREVEIIGLANTVYVIDVRVE